MSEEKSLVVGSRGIMPTTLDEMGRFCATVIKAGLAPNGIDTPEKALICLQTGLELGLSPMQALRGSAPIHGTPMVWGKVAQGLVLGSGLVCGVCEHFEGEDDEYAAFCEMERVNVGKIRGTFSVAQAKVAGLLVKDTYRKYLDDMLMWRARSRCWAQGFSDVLCGLGIIEDAHPEKIFEAKVVEPKPEALDLSEFVDDEPVSDDTAAAIEDVFGAKEEE